MDQGLRNPVQYYDQQSNNAVMNGFAPGAFPGAAPLNAPAGLGSLPGAPYGMVYRENGMQRYGMSQEHMEMQASTPSQSPFGVSQFPNQRNAPIPDGMNYVEKNMANQNSFNARRKMEGSNGSYPANFDPNFAGKSRSAVEMDPNFSSSPSPYQTSRHGQQFNNPNPAFQSPTQSNPHFSNFGSQPPMQQAPSPGMEFMLQQQQQQQFNNFANQQNFQQQQQTQAQPQPQMQDGMFQRSEAIPQEAFGMMPQQGLPSDPSFNQQAQQQNPAFHNTNRNQQQLAGPAQMPNYGDSSRFSFNTSSPQSNKSAEGVTDSQKQAAMMAAAAVRAAAAASARQRSGYHPSPTTPNSFGFGQRRVSPHDASGSPFGSHGSGMQSPSSVKEFPIMSPVGDGATPVPYSSSPSPFGQRGMAQPPPYSSSENAKPHPSPSTFQQSRAKTGAASLQQQQQKISKQEFRRASCDSMSPTSHSQKALDSADISDHADILPDLPVVEGMGAIIDAVASEGDVPTGSRGMPMDRNPANMGREQERKLLVSPTHKSSAPPTPLSGMSGISPVPSPFQDDLDLDALSPSWPQTPSSPNARKLLQSQSPNRFDQLSKLYELSDDEERRDFLDKYLAFMSINGTPVTKVPVIAKQPLDLYRLCRVMIEKGGLQEVMKKKRFREVLKALNLPSGNSSVALTVKNQYIKYLLPYENKMKDQLLRKWQQPAVMGGNVVAPVPAGVPKAKASMADVPTIALNDTMTSAMKDVSRHSNSTAHYQNNAFPPRPGPMAGMPPGFRPEWEGYPPNSGVQMNYPMQGQGPNYSTQTNNSYMGMPQRPPFSSPTSGAGFPEQPQYTSSVGNEMPLQFTSTSYPGFQHQMMMRQQNMYLQGPQGVPTSLAPNMNHDMTGSTSWQRQFPQRGPPELYPEGLQRHAWMPPQQQGMSQPRPQPPQTPPVKGDRFDPSQRAHRPPSRDHGEANEPAAKDFAHPTPHKLKPPSMKKGLHHHSSLSSSKLEPSLFPPDCVESTRPVLTRKRKWTSKQLGPVEAWRIMMSLKSGLLAECTWAIDALNILLYDNQTITYFHLAQLPGLLDTLVDHYRRCLIDVFHLSDIDEVPRLNDRTSNGDRSVEAKQTYNSLWVGVCRNALKSFSAVVASNAVVCDASREGFKSGRGYWSSGGGDDTSHILMSFPNCHVPLRAFPGVTKDTTTVEERHADDQTTFACDAHNKRKTSVCRSCLSESVLIEDIATFLPLQSKAAVTQQENTKATVKIEKPSIEAQETTEVAVDKSSEVPDEKSDVLPAVNESSGSKSTTESVDKAKSDEDDLPEVTNGPMEVELKTENEPSICEPKTSETSEPVEEPKETTTAVETASVKTEPEGTDSDMPTDRSRCSTPTDIIERKRMNLCHSEGFAALDGLIKEQVDASCSDGMVESGDDPLLRQIKKELIFESDCNAEYLEGSREFIGYLRKRLKHENRGRITCDESVSKPSSALTTNDDAQEFRLRRCVALSNIFRSLSFIAGNDAELAGHPGLLLLTGSLLLLKHHHPVIDHSEFRLGQEDQTTGEKVDRKSNQRDEWWWDGLQELRENALVVLANISGHLDLSHYPEKISLPIIDGLLHWLVCQSSEARDAMPTAPEAHALSPKRLALEALAKLSITEGNVDLILATPPTQRLEKVFSDLIFGIGIKSCVPSREFCVVLLDNLAHGENAPQLIAAQRSSLSKLLSFLEEAEGNTTSFLSSGGVVQPGLSAEEVCGTSVNMLRRAADTLLCLARIVSNRTMFLPFMDRLLALSMSQMMDTSVLSILGEVMFELR